MFDPLNFLTLSRELLDGNIEENYLRTSIGRSYYAVYLYAREKYAKSTMDNSVYSNHAKLINDLKNRPEPTFRKLGNQLSDLKIDRESADYKINISINKTMAEKAYSSAERIKKTIEQIPPHL